MDVKRVEDLLPCTRRDLPYVFGCNDRTAREMIYRARESGLPILMPDKDDNRYRVAETDEEVLRCYRDLRDRALRGLAAANAMMRRYQPAGQQGI